LSLRGAQRRSNLVKYEIPTPFALDTMRCPEPLTFRVVQDFGLAMTTRMLES
jgi:hypothetical protein